MKNKFLKNTFYRVARSSSWIMNCASSHQKCFSIMMKRYKCYVNNNIYNKYEYIPRNCLELVIKTTFKKRFELYRFDSNINFKFFIIMSN